MPPAPPLLRNHSTLSSSSSPSSTFDNAPGNHYLQELEPEPEFRSPDAAVPGSSPPTLPSPSNNNNNNPTGTYTYTNNTTTGGGGGQGIRSPTSRVTNRTNQLRRSQIPLAGTMPYGVPSFHHSAGTAGTPYFTYNPSEVELSTIGMSMGMGMGMSMYETLNPLAATTMLASTAPGMAGTAGVVSSGKKGVYAPIDSSYYAAYTQPQSVIFGGGGGESIYAGGLGFNTQQQSVVNPRYISGKSEGAVENNSGSAGREAVLKRVRRDAGVFEEELRRLVGAQEEALGMAGNSSSSTATATTTASTTGKVMGRRGRRKMGIKDVRIGILEAMVGLADVKAVEEDWYASEGSVRSELVEMVEKWGRKRGRLEKEVERVEGGVEGREMERVRERLEGVEEQIRVHEAELKRLKSEQTAMLSKISELQSTLSSRLSSYTSSIQKMSKDMTEFLRSPNVLLPTPPPAAGGGSGASKSTLPFTPEQAIEYWKDERRVFEEKKAEASRELDALRDGVGVWQESVGLIADFEDMMARELIEAQRESKRQEILQEEEKKRKLERSRSPRIRTGGMFGKGVLDDSRPGSSGGFSAGTMGSGRNTPVSVFANRNRRGGGGLQGHSRNGSLSSSTETFKAAATTSLTGPTITTNTATKEPPKIPEATAAKLVAGIENVISQLNSRLTLAEQKGWTLLVCVLGAEMESYKEARAALVPLIGGLVDTSSAGENVLKKVKGKGKASELTSPSDDALNESLHGLGFDGHQQQQQQQKQQQQHAHGLHEGNHWNNSESESEIDDPAALFGAEGNGDIDSSPELRARASPKGVHRRLRAVTSEEEDELEYAAFASLNLHDSGHTPATSVTPTSTTTVMNTNMNMNMGGNVDTEMDVGNANAGSGRSTVVGEGVRRVSSTSGGGGGAEEEDIHGAFLET